jgi:hypothetical protein
MTPMAGGIAAGKQDGFVFGFGFLERFLTPGVPVDGVVGVLEEIRRGFVDKAVGIFGFRHNIFILLGLFFLKLSIPKSFTLLYVDNNFHM